MRSTVHTRYLFPLALVTLMAGCGAPETGPRATGNWIKVVQRLPVRIALDPKEVAAHPLQLGLSMRVEVDTSARQGTHFAVAANMAHAYRTGVFSKEGIEAAAAVKRIIVANIGGAAAGAGAGGAASLAAP